MKLEIGLTDDKKSDIIALWKFESDQKNLVKVLWKGIALEQALEQIVAANIAELRRARGWTQAELAEKINYSDKSVSKWERGAGLPDLKVLMQLSELFEVSLDTLVTEQGAVEHQAKSAKKPRVAPRVITDLLSVSLIFLIATVLYTAIATYAHVYAWTCFIWALPVSFGALTLLNLHWKYRVCAIVFGSIFAWSFLTAVYLQLLPYNLWMLFLIGVPAQAAIILGAQLRRKKRD